MRFTFLLFALVLLAGLGGCGDDQGTGVDGNDKGLPDVKRHDLQVSHVSLEPRLPPPMEPDPPPEAGWPDPGSETRWVAHLRNRGVVGSGPIPYVWEVDGVVTDSGEVSLIPGETLLEFPWIWEEKRRKIGFRLLVPDSLGGSENGDKVVAVSSDALTVGFWVERSTYEWLNRPGQKGFERWAHDQVELWNSILARPNFPSILPHTVADRLRLERVTILPDRSGWANDMDTDLSWYYPAYAKDGRFLDCSSPDAVIRDQTIVLHEMMHQRGLTDLYAYRVWHGTPNGSRVGILEDGKPIAGSYLMPFVKGKRVYEPSINGLMGNQYHSDALVSEHSVFGLNLHAGRRTPYWDDVHGGRWSAFFNGPYVNYIPATTAVRVVETTTREPIKHAEIDLFLDWGTLSYQDIYRPEPDLSFTADEDGVFSLPGTILNGTPTITFEPKSWVLILRVRSGSLRDYLFLPGYQLNLLHFRGDSLSAFLELEADLR